MKERAKVTSKRAPEGKIVDLQFEASEVAVPR